MRAHDISYSTVTMEQANLRELINIKKSIRNKVISLKLNENDNETQFRKKFKPLIEPLNELVSQTIKDEPRDLKDETVPPATNTKKNDFSTPSVLFALKEEAPGTVMESEEEFDPLDAQKKLPRHYMDQLVFNKKEIDLTYGAKFHPRAGAWTMGNKQIKFDGEEIVIIDKNSMHSKSYRGTPGLYELIFKKNPVGFTKADSQQYADILIRTSSHRSKSNPDEPVKWPNTAKYRNIIKPLLAKRTKKKQTTGAGGEYDANMLVDNKTTKYVYFNEYDELVDRMRKLYASKEAGNTSHDNEIQSIIEELREGGIIY